MIEFEIYDGDDHYASVSGPLEQAWPEALNYASQCGGEPRIEVVTRTPVAACEVCSGRGRAAESFARCHPCRGTGVYPPLAEFTP